MSAKSSRTRALSRYIAFPCRDPFDVIEIVGIALDAQYGIRLPKTGA